MSSRTISLRLATAGVLVALVAVPGAGSAPAEPGTSAAVDTAFAYVDQNLASLGGLSAADASDLAVSSSYRDAHNGVTHVYLQQRYKGITVTDALATVNIGANGQVIYAGSSLRSGLAAAAEGSVETGAAAATEAAADELGLSNAEIAGTSAPKLAYHPLADGTLRLAWSVTIAETSGDHVWETAVDAETGELIVAEDTVIYEDEPEEPDDPAGPADKDPLNAAQQGPGLHPKPKESKSPNRVHDGSSYRVYAIPTESPYDGPRKVVKEPADALASPFGWHDVDGIAGADFTITKGNNAEAYTDFVPPGNTIDPGSQPDGGAGLDFDFQIDLTKNVSEYRPAAVVNLFYWCNIMHDVLYQYGFNEVSGNYQVNNYGRGGIGGDDVRCEAQDGSGTNNANFSSGLEGTRGRMQMFIWTYGRPNTVRVDAPNPAAGDYEASTASFGPPLVIGSSTAGAFELGHDGVGTDTDGCSPLVGFTAGKIALLDRSSTALCNFPTRVKNAQNAGAIAAVLVNNVSGNPANLTGTDSTITIPSTMIGINPGTALKANLPASGSLFRDPVRGVTRDGDLDAGIILHEYGHGVSNRLTGGPLKTSGCLGGQEQMGEGWSDWQSVSLLGLKNDTGPGRRGVGGYALWQSGRHDTGIRPTAYSTNRLINPSTYDTIKTAAVPHGVGYVWNTMLWELYWNLVDEYGFDKNVYHPWWHGGNNLAIQLVTDGMKFQPCNPGFVNGRDAILAADVALTGGENQCLIWRGFAKRGLGFNASQGTSASRSDGVQAFNTHPDCPALPVASVDPTSLSLTAESGKKAKADLTLANGAALPGDALEWTTTEAASNCASASDLDWVKSDHQKGSLAPGADKKLKVELDAKGLAPGTVVTGVLCIGTNDPDPADAVLEVPLTLTVT
jgi:extracellular elastinolytic metalloproteinase